MPSIYSPQDVGAIGNLAGTLAVPALAVAVMLDWGFACIVGSAWPSEIGTLSVPWLRVASIALLFGTVVTAVAFVHNLLEQVLTTRPQIFYLVGLSLIAFGLLGLGEYTQVLLPFKTNFFWHFGCLCWGLDVFRPQKRPPEASQETPSK